jgi:subtilisin family serine protease
MNTLLLSLLVAFALQPEAKTSNDSRYWIFFVDKNDHVCTYDKVACLLAPPDSSWLNELTSLGAHIHVISNWLHAVSVSASLESLQKISTLPIVESIGPVLNLRSHTEVKHRNQSQEFYKTSFFDNTLNVYGGTEAQIKYHNIDQVHALGYDGEGVIVGIMDGGFDMGHEAFQHLIDSKRILAERDFVDGGNNTKSNVKNSSYHSHGTSVAAIIAGKIDHKLVGVAPGVSLVIARTEDDEIEAPIEEDHWIEAIEWMQKSGVKVVNTSLGYNIFTSQPQSSYTYNDMNGKTSAIAKAATKAASLFNMIIVVSAGNEGNSDWKYITTPADADSILSVGSISSNGLKVASSSIGPTSDGRIKPDVMARGACVYSANSSSTSSYSSCLNGTSFAAPHVAGIMALAVQARPNKPAIWYVEQARKTSNRANNPDNQYGYGSIDAKKLIDIVVTSDNEQKQQPDWVFLSKNYPNPFNPSTVIQYQAPTSWSLIRFNIYDSLGRLVRNVQLDSYINNGYIGWDGRSTRGNTLPSGVYFGRLLFSNGYEYHERVHPMSLIK